MPRNPESELIARPADGEVPFTDHVGLCDERFKKTQPLWLSFDSFWKPVLEVVAVAAVYYGAARLGLLLQLPGTNASPVWPPSGIGLAAVLLFGLRVWPGIALGAFWANLLTLPSTPAGFLVAVAIAAGNTLEHVIARLLIGRLIPSLNPFERARDVFWFVVTGALACAVASTTGLWPCRSCPWREAARVWSRPDRSPAP